VFPTKPAFPAKRQYYGARLAILRFFNSAAETLTTENRKNCIYEAGVGVKQKKKKLCLCRQVSLIAGDKFGDPDCLVTI